MDNVGVIGSINQDVVLNMRRIPRLGETIADAKVGYFPGGKGANQSIAAAAHGASVAIMGAVGNDEPGRAMLENLQAHGIDTTLVRVLDESITGMASIWVSEDGDNAIALAPGANKRLLPDGPMIEKFVAGRDVVVASLEVPLGTIELAAKISLEANAAMVLNLSPFRPFSPLAMKCVHTLVVNEIEANDLLGVSVLEPSAAESLARDAVATLGVIAVVITLGPDGAVVATDSRVVHIPAPAVEVVDTTGAGDAFLGTYAAELAAGAAIIDAVSAAVESASQSVTRHGAQV